MCGFLILRNFALPKISGSIFRNYVPIEKTRLGIPWICNPTLKLSTFQYGPGLKLSNPGEDRVRLKLINCASVAGQ